MSTIDQHALRFMSCGQWAHHAHVPTDSKQHYTHRYIKTHSCMTNHMLNHLCVPCISCGSNIHGSLPLVASTVLFMTKRAAMKRPLGSGCKGRSPKVSSACAGDRDDGMIVSKSGPCRTDRNKKYYLTTHSHLLPDCINKMLAGLACQQRGKTINHLVQAVPGGGYTFNLSHTFVQDFLHAIVVYSLSTV